MMSTVVSKRYDAAAAKVDREKPYSVEEAIATLKGMPAAKFDESVDLSFRLGVDPKHADQMVRGAVVMPNGIGKVVRVAVFAKGEKEREAREAGADVVGAEDLVERIQGGWMEFDTAIATPDLMGQVGRLGELKQRLGGVKTAVLTEYRGLTVRQMSELRKQLRDASATCKVVKNRIAKLAIADSPLRGLAPYFKGPTAIVISTKDPLPVAK